MSKLIAYLFLFFFSLILPSCFTASYIQIEVLRPPLTSLPEEIHDIALINRNVLIINDSLINDTSVVIETIPEYLYNLVSTEAVLSVGAIISEIPSLIHISGENILEILPGDSIYARPIINEYELEEFKIQTGANGLLSLDYIRLRDDLAIEEIYRMIDGAYTPYYVAYIQRYMWALWRLYDLNQLTLLDEFLFMDSLIFYAPDSGWDREKAMQKMLLNIDFISQTYLKTGYHMGFSYAKKIAPVFHDEERIFFTGKSRWLIRAERFIFQNEFKAAEDILLRYSRHENRKKSAVAFHNLAIISEIEGDFELARFYAKMALKRYRFQQISDYLKILEKRIEEKKIIDRYLLL